MAKPGQGIQAVDLQARSEPVLAPGSEEQGRPVGPQHPFQGVAGTESPKP